MYGNFYMNRMDIL